MNIRKFVVGLGVAAGAFVGGVGVAAADHVHSVEVGGGKCVLLAQHGGEKYVVLPFGAGFPEAKRHPIHVLVHMGEPGQGGHLNIGVYGNSANDPCYNSGDYVND